MDEVMFIEVTDEKEMAAIGDAIAHCKRIRILRILRECKEPIILSELTRRVSEKEAVSTISKHVKVMERSGVVKTFKIGTNVFVGLKKDVKVYVKELSPKLRFRG